MAKKIRSKTSQKIVVRFKRKMRIRSTLSGTAERPRLSVFRSNRHLSLQLIDDVKGCTLVSASTQEEGFTAKTPTIEAAKELGQRLGKKAIEMNITQVVFDRSGYLYHGRLKALADSVREAGLKC
jgi:large subunit ribosomal protein L18